VNEELIRTLVRETIARHAAGGIDSIAPPDADAPLRPLSFVGHGSHYRYTTLPSSGGPCLIEPSVKCNHCGYCQSHGH
jgi:hypothetical protein